MSRVIVLTESGRDSDDSDALACLGPEGGHSGPFGAATRARSGRRFVMNVLAVPVVQVGTSRQAPSQGFPIPADNRDFPNELSSTCVRGGRRRHGASRYALSF